MNASSKEVRMITASIPGWGDLSLEYLLVDFNGTAAFDGELREDVKEVLTALSSQVKVFIVTADTYGTVQGQIADGKITIEVAKALTGHEKAKLVRELGPEKVAAIGNGGNDALMLREAALGIGIIGQEGCAATILKEADVVVTDIVDALELLLYPKRLIATLRD
jgi:P-type E1-E2 ATPase